jgi:hypothetical protein
VGPICWCFTHWPKWYDWAVSYLAIGEDERERERERAETGGGRDSPEEGRAVDGDDAESAEEGLLLHLQQAARRGRPWFAGASRWPGRSSVARASPASWVKEARENKMLSGRLQRLPSVAWSSQWCVVYSVTMVLLRVWTRRRRARTWIRKWEATGECLGGRGEWCEYGGVLREGSYSQERESRRRPEEGVRRRATGRCRTRRLWAHADMRGLVLWCCHMRAGMLEMVGDVDTG